MDDRERIRKKEKVSCKLRYCCDLDQIHREIITKRLHCKMAVLNNAKQLQRKAWLFNK